MTTQTKKFIELSDILNLRFRCKACGVELLIPSSRDLSAREEHGKLKDCPVCYQPWATVNQSSCEFDISGFLKALHKLRGTMESFPAGFTLALEIAAEESHPVTATSA